MGIRVSHQPDPMITGKGAYAGGVAQYAKEERRRQEEFGFQRETQNRSIDANRESQLRSIEANRISQLTGIAAQQQSQYNQIMASERMAMFEQQAAMERYAQQAQYQWEMDQQRYYNQMAQMQYEATLDHDQMAEKQKMVQDQMVWEYTQGQQMQQQQILEQWNKAEEEFANGNINASQLEAAKTQLEAQYLGVKQLPQKAQYRPGTEPGKVFYLDQKTAQLYGEYPVEDAAGNPIPLTRDPESGKIEIMRGYKPVSEGEVIQRENAKLQHQEQALELEQKKKEAAAKMYTDLLSQTDEITNADGSVTKQQKWSPEQAQQMALDFFNSPQMSSNLANQGAAVNGQAGAQAQQVNAQTLVQPDQLPLVDTGNGPEIDMNVLGDAYWNSAVAAGRLDPQSAEKLSAALNTYANEFSALGYGEGMDASAFMAYAYQAYGTNYAKAVKDPDIRFLIRQSDMILRMSGLEWDDSTGQMSRVHVTPQSLDEVKAMRPGVVFVDPKTGQPRVYKGTGQAFDWGQAMQTQSREVMQ